MLVTDPKQRANMYEVLTHPWMNKSYNGPPDNYVPVREPLTLPLDHQVIMAMTGFNFGPPEVIKNQLQRTIESEEYQRTVRAYEREKEIIQPSKDPEKKRGVFDFYKRRNSMNSRDTLTTPSAEGLPIGNDPINAYDPLISIYYLVREKQERDRAALAAAQPSPAPAKEKEPVLEIAPPKEAHTNTSAYEMPGEKATGGRTRPRARTHGEDDAPEQVKQAQLSPNARQKPEPATEQAPKKESAAAGIFRRLSRREKRSEPTPEKTERTEKDRSHPPQVHVHSPAESPGPSVLRKSFSIRRSRRERDDSSRQRAGSSQPQHSDLLSPPPSASGKGHGKGLGRSTSVSSAEFARRRTADSARPESKDLRDGRDAKDPPPTSGSDQSTTNVPATSSRKAPLNSQTVAYRAKSLGHARRESIQARRLRREQEASREANVPEETDAEIGEQSGISTDRLEDPELAKPVFLKGLFSVSTTSTRPVPEMRADIKRVLKQLGVEYYEIKGGFRCNKSPSIDLNKANSELPQTSVTAGAQTTPGHKRRFSFGGLRAGGGNTERDPREREDLNLPATPRTPGNGKGPLRHDDSDSRSDISEADPTSRDPGQERKLPPGETSTHVQNDLSDNMVLKFEIFVVKVPMISLHGIQFKRLEGNTWQYKNMADQILRELRL
jgi:serine/threonine protein kinase KIN1/2